MMYTSRGGYSIKLVRNPKKAFFKDEIAQADRQSIRQRNRCVSIYNRESAAMAAAVYIPRKRNAY